MVYGTSGVTALKGPLPEREVAVRRQTPIEWYHPVRCRQGVARWTLYLFSAGADGGSAGPAYSGLHYSLTDHASITLY